jgi:hypothetical protein
MLRLAEPGLMQSNSKQFLRQSIEVSFVYSSEKFASYFCTLSFTFPSLLQNAMGEG